MECLRPDTGYMYLYEQRSLVLFVLFFVLFCSFVRPCFPVLCLLVRAYCAVPQIEEHRKEKYIDVRICKESSRWS